VRSYLVGKDRNGLVNTRALLSLVDDWKFFLTGAEAGFSDELEKHECTAQPLGSGNFVEMAGELMACDLQKKKPGPKL